MNKYIATKSEKRQSIQKKPENSDLKARILSLYDKYGEILRYLIFGVLGVVVSIVAYVIPRAIGIDIVISNIISWIVAVIFVYWTNRQFVFKSKDPNIAKEMVEFVSARILTLFVETGVIYFCAQVIMMNDMIAKVIAQIIIIIMNYILSKFWIFSKGEKLGEKDAKKLLKDSDG